MHGYESTDDRDLFDAERNRVLRYFRITPARPVIMAASTRKGEEAFVLEAFQRIRATMTSKTSAIGVDIASGEGQALATPPNFGGPGVGLFACRNDRKYLQQMPGGAQGGGRGTPPPDKQKLKKQKQQ